MNSQVLVLNQNYEPLNITNARRAINLIILGKAQVVESNGQLVRSERLSLAMPEVVRMAYYVRRPLPELKISRRGIFARDNYTCQYCGRSDGALTLDHVIPKHSGGETAWSNVVCCCRRCNGRKGNRLPEEVGMHLLRHPRQPRLVPYISFPKLMLACRHQPWRPYLLPFIDRSLVPRD